MTPLNLGADVVGVNTVDVNPVHQLLAFGLDGEGTVQFWDPRSRSSVGTLRLPHTRLTGSTSSARPFLPGIDDENTKPSLSISALASRSDGLSYAVGTSTGHTLLYDIRSTRPFATKDQGYGLPVKSLTWIDGGSRMAGDGMVMSADKKVVKIWDRNSVGQTGFLICYPHDLTYIISPQQTSLPSLLQRTSTISTTCLVAACSYVQTRESRCRPSTFRSLVQHRSGVRSSKTSPKRWRTRQLATSTRTTSSSSGLNLHGTLPSRFCMRS
jgi:hypothetical protein